MRLSLLILGIVLIAASPARADEIRLRNGSVIQGRIVREDKDFVVIEIGRGRMNLARRDIVAITMSHVESVEPASGSPAPGARNPANPPPPATATPPTRRVRPATEEATPTEGEGAPRAPVVLPNRRVRGMPTPGPKIVAVDRVPAQPLTGVGPESDAPPRKSPTRAATAPESNGSAAKPTASRATPKPDW